jgi:ribosomal-protein-alanine N-acetyltransferase
VTLEPHTEKGQWVVETERLAFRYFTLTDLPQLIEQRSDPEVNKYLGGPDRQNAKGLATRIRFYIDCYGSHGFGMCPMIWKESEKVIGTAGLQPLENTPDIEVGYSLIKEYWSQGIATEAARAWMEFGFRDKGLDRIVAVADRDNQASQRIMEKLGMKFEKTEIHYDIECSFYGVSKLEFYEHNS